MVKAQVITEAIAEHVAICGVSYTDIMIHRRADLEPAVQKTRDMSRLRAKHQLSSL
jgi:hypothetical protein